MIDVNTAYLILQNDVLKRGLDWSKPLAPQYAAIAANNNGGNTAPNGQGNNRQLPPMNGRQSSNTVPAGKSRVAEVNDSYDSIINEVLAEQGVRVN